MSSDKELTPEAKAYLEIMKKQSEAAANGQGPRVVALDGNEGGAAQHKFWDTQVCIPCTRF